ncbi:MAG TPA: serine--tRNA ligase, partial [Thermomicrobiales bacterium]|nr:serine--tRNA ligase [Thermomicrobiales bacterium]
MIDIRLIRENPEAVKAAIATLYLTAPIDRIVELDAERRILVTDLDGQKAARNDGSKQVAQTRDPELRAQLIADMKAVGDAISAGDARLAVIDAELNQLLLEVPNLPLAEVPIGKDDSENVVVRQWGELPTYPFTVRPHWETGPELGIIDFERGVKIAGSRFYVLTGLGAKLQRAIIDWMLDFHVQKHGYTEVAPPYMVLGEMLVGTGNLPKFGENLFRDIEEDRWFIPTAEVPVTNLYRDEILEAASLPRY